jgi:hypothetical protein
MNVVNKIGFASKADALGLAKAIWKLQEEEETHVYCEVCFDDNSVYLIGRHEDIKAIVGGLPPLESDPREC